MITKHEKSKNLICWHKIKSSSSTKLELLLEPPKCCHDNCPVSITIDEQLRRVNVFWYEGFD